MKKTPICHSGEARNVNRGGGNYTVGHKKRATLLLSISSPIIDQFSKSFHWHTLQTTCNNVIINFIIYPTTRGFLQMRFYTTL